MLIYILKNILYPFEILIITVVQQTRNDLEDIGISTNYRVYYTSNIISKGDYIMENIDLTPYENVIFIDDKIENIDSVGLRFPKIITYQFII
jgi:hypothetical protein